MKPLPELASEAHARRAQFSATLREVRLRMVPATLADEALGVIMPRIGGVRKLHGAVKSHPLIAAGVIAGAGFLLRHAFNGTAPPAEETPRSAPRPIRKRRP